MAKNILFILKDAKDFDPLKEWIAGAGYQAELYSKTAEMAQGIGYDAVIKEAMNCFLLLVDIDMPWAFEFCQYIKSDPRGKAVPLIMMAYRAKLAEVASAIKAGADNFIIKPFDVDYFVGRIKTIEREVELRSQRKKLIDLSLLKFVFTLMNEEAPPRDIFALFKVSFERAILEKAIFIVGEPVVATALRSALTRVEKQYPFLESLKWEAAKGFLADQAVASSAENKGQIVPGFKALVSKYLEILHVLTSDVLVEEKL